MTLFRGFDFRIENLRFSFFGNMNNIQLFFFLVDCLFLRHRNIFRSKAHGRCGERFDFIPIFIHKGNIKQEHLFHGVDLCLINDLVIICLIFRRTFPDGLYLHGYRHIFFIKGFLILKADLDCDIACLFFKFKRPIVFFLFFLLLFFDDFFQRFRTFFRLFLRLCGFFRCRSYFRLCGRFLFLNHCLSCCRFFRLNLLLCRVARFRMNMFRSVTDQYLLCFSVAFFTVIMAFLFFLAADEISFFVIAAFIMKVSFSLLKTANQRSFCERVAGQIMGMFFQTADRFFSPGFRSYGQ